ncbi:MAG: hypothetical protein SNG35_03215 [Rikenellaceae bacterium]
MKEFDIEDIGKKMPYNAPPEEFFVQFKERMVREVAEQEHSVNGRSSKLVRLRLLIPMVAAAAMLLVGVFVFDRLDHRQAGIDAGFYISESVDQSIDDYFSNLSDEELSSLMAGASTNDDFYLTLLTDE